MSLRALEWKINMEAYRARKSQQNVTSVVKDNDEVLLFKSQKFQFMLILF
jgi:hypothetical protein